MCGGSSEGGRWIADGVLDDDIAGRRGRLHRVRLDGTGEQVINEDPLIDADALQIRDSAGSSALLAIYSLS